MRYTLRFGSHRVCNDGRRDWGLAQDLLVFHVEDARYVNTGVQDVEESTTKQDQRHDPIQIPPHRWFYAIFLVDLVWTYLLDRK